MTEFPRVSLSELEAELASGGPPRRPLAPPPPSDSPPEPLAPPLPDLPPDGILVNGRRFLAVTEPHPTGTGGVQVKRRGSDGTVIYRVRMVSGVPGDEHAGEFALKRIPNCTASDRGRREVRNLRALKHPAIVRFEDAELRDDAMLLVMEWCEGTPITEYVTDAHTDDERFKLFFKVCAATQHAHDLGVYHRDLKPDHIVVREEAIDGTTRPPKVLIRDWDNGVVGNPARATTDTGNSATIRRRGTPDYASPNQFQWGEGHPTDDQYSLGILLGELLTGAAPPGNGRQWTERGRLDADLFQILQKATAPIPERRYPKVEEFKEDLERYRRGRVLHGVPQGLRTRAYKFGRRNLKSILVAFLLALAGTINFVLWRVASGERERAESQQQRAVEASITYRRLAGTLSAPEFLKRLLDSSPEYWREEGRQILDELNRTYSHSDRTNPEDCEFARWRGEGFAALGEVYRHLGEYELAIDKFQHAESIHRAAIERQPGADEDRRLLCEALKGQAEVRRQQRRLEDALDAARRASGEAAMLSDDARNRSMRSQVASVHANILSNLSTRQGNAGLGLKKEAEQLFEDALRFCATPDSSADAPFGLAAARVLNSLGNHSAKWGEAQTASKTHEKGLKALVDSPTDPPLVRRKKDMVRAQHLQGIGVARLATGDTAGAEMALTNARDIRLRLHADERGAPLICADVASTRLALARLRDTEGRLSDALIEIEAGLGVLSPWAHSRIPAVREFDEQLLAFREKLRKK